MVIIKNSLWLGIVLAVLSPVAALTYYYYLKFDPVQVDLYFQLLLTDTSHLRTIAAAYLMLNSFIFFAFVNTDKMLTAYGVFFATLILGLATFFVNAIWAG